MNKTTVFVFLGCLFFLGSFAQTTSVKELLGEIHIDVAKGYDNIGLVYVDNSEYDLALQYYFKALTISKELLGEKHTSVATGLSSIGLVYANKNEYDLALEYQDNS